MVEEPTTLTRERPNRRAAPSRGRILVRRVVALAFLAGLVAVVAGSAWAVFGGGEEKAAPPPAPVAPAPKPLRIIFPEGFTREQMSVRIDEVNQIARDRRNVRPRLSPVRYLALTDGLARAPTGFLRRGERPPHLEGFLFPSTYEFTKRTTTRQLVNGQLAAFERNWAKVNMRYARSRNLTPYDVLIIASMVEREVAVAAERPLVAAVIYNRLKAGMTLGIDATIRYGLGVPATESLRESHLSDQTPYNTRIHAGLPPTPIANPGLASMRAAARPAKVDYLFFVRKPGKKSHFFTASEREFVNYMNANGYG
jgi:uncharacterized YceG family protein